MRGDGLCNAKAIRRTTRWAARCALGVAAAFSAALVMSGAPAQAQSTPAASAADEYSGLREAARRREAELRAAAEGGRIAPADQGERRRIVPRKPPKAAPVPRRRPARAEAALAAAPARRIEPAASAHVTEPTAAAQPAAYAPKPEESSLFGAPARLEPSPPLLSLPAKPSAQAAEPSSSEAPDPLVALLGPESDEEPAPRARAAVAAPVEIRRAEPASGGLLSDPTVRIVLAFVVGVGLLGLAFLREWAAARRGGQA